MIEYCTDNTLGMDILHGWHTFGIRDYPGHRSKFPDMGWFEEKEEGDW